MRVNVKVLQEPHSPCYAAIYPDILSSRWEPGGRENLCETTEEINKVHVQSHPSVP